ADWLAIYGTNGHEVNLDAYMWHVFSAERYPSLAGPRALEAYGRQTGEEFIVLANDREQAFATDRLPTSSSLADYFVFPPNLAWTMAFTHEDGWLGPYFARHPEFARLEAAAQASARKRRETEEARRKGWC